MKHIQFNIEFDVQVLDGTAITEIEDGLKLALFNYAAKVGWMESLVIKQGGKQPKEDSVNS